MIKSKQESAMPHNTSNNIQNNKVKKLQAFVHPNQQRMKIYGHRGMSSIKKENTISAIMEAYHHGADGYEIDIQLTKDEKLVVLHDTTLERTAQGIISNNQNNESIRHSLSLYEKNYHEIIKEPIHTLNYSQIKMINIGTEIEPESPPLLQEVLLKTCDLKFPCLIEVKLPENTQIAQKISLLFTKALIECFFQLQQKKKMTNKQLSSLVQIISFDTLFLQAKQQMLALQHIKHHWIRCVQGSHTNLKTDATLLYDEDSITNAKNMDCIGIDLECNENTHRLTKPIKQAGLELMVWVRGRSQSTQGTDGVIFAKQMAEHSVDLFTSNITPNMLQ